MNKQQFPSSFILPIHPKEYREQLKSHCGAFTVQAVLSAYDLDDTRDPWELHTEIFPRIIGASPSMDYYPRLLRSYGLIARAKNATGMGHADRVTLLKRLLVDGNPVILSVGSFFNRDTGEFDESKGRLASHWVSLWGYDEQSFFTYDSLVRKRLSDADAPIGNKARSYDMIMRMWTGSIFSRMLLGKYSYIYIKRP